MRGNIRQEIDPTKEGITATQIHYDTAQRSGGVVLTDNQTGNSMDISHNSSGEHVGLYDKTGSKNIKFTHDSQGFNVKGHAFETQIGDTEVTNTNFNFRDQTASGTLHHENGSETLLNTNRSNTTITHRDGDSYHQANVGRDGQVGLQGRISRMADPEKEGVTVTDFNYNTHQGSVETVITDNKSGRNVSISRDRNGIDISTGDGVQTNTTVSIDRSGINIRGKNGRSVNVGKVIGFIKGLTR